LKNWILSTSRWRNLIWAWYDITDEGSTKKGLIILVNPLSIEMGIQ
jgi:hypothetical protein